MTKTAPIKVLPEGPEIEPKKTGHRFTDMIVAGAAILISLTSLGVAVKHGLIMKQLVAANSWPLLQYSSGNFNTENNSPEIGLTITNVGVGPAIVREFSIFYKNQKYTNIYKLLKDCCDYVVTTSTPYTSGLTNAFVEGTVIRAGEERPYLIIKRAGNEKTWDQLDKVRFKLKFDACYCSVFNECWRSDIVDIDPKPVKSCVAKHPAAPYSN